MSIEAQSDAVFTAADLMRKISALLDTAESYAAQGNIAAADSYTDKAHALQARYSIDQAMLDAHKDGKISETVVISREVTISGTHGNRRSDLCNGVAKAVGCTGYYSTANSYEWLPDEFRHRKSVEYKYVIFGYPADVEWAETLFNSLDKQLEIEMKLARRHHKAEQANVPKWYREHGKSFAVEFIAGFVRKVESRLYSLKFDAQRAAKVEERQQRRDRFPDFTHLTDDELEKLEDDASRSVSLVLADKQNRVDKEMRAKVKLTNRRSTERDMTTSGYGRGQAAGARATITRGGVGKGNTGAIGKGE